MASPISANFSTSFSDINTGLMGGDSSGTSGGSEAIAKTSTEQLDIDKEGLLLLIDQALQGTGGIAEIFGAEAGAGLFGSSSAKNQTEDLLAKIAGELALVTGKKTTTSGEVKESSASSSSSTSGLFDSLAGDSKIGNELIQPGFDSASGMNLVNLTGDLFSGDLF